MVVEISKSFDHVCSNATEAQYSDQELQEIMLQLMEKGGINTDQVRISADGVVQVEACSNLKLHGVMLQLEKMGVKTKYTKKTLIEIC